MISKIKENTFSPSPRLLLFPRKYKLSRFAYFTIQKYQGYITPCLDAAFMIKYIQVMYCD